MNYEFIDSLDQICQNNKGECNLSIKVIDATENIGVDLLSRKYKVNPSNEMIDSLDKDKIKYKILV